MEQNIFRELPSRIRHYLLEWKDDNLDEYIEMWGEKKLKEMTQEELEFLFRYASHREFQKELQSVDSREVLSPIESC